MIFKQRWSGVNEMFPTPACQTSEVWYHALRLSTPETWKPWSGKRVALIAGVGLLATGASASDVALARFAAAKETQARQLAQAQTIALFFYGQLW
jgi:hypothetical protein